MVLTFFMFFFLALSFVPPSTGTHKSWSVTLRHTLRRQEYWGRARSCCQQGLPITETSRWCTCILYLDCKDLTELWATTPPAKCVPNAYTRDLWTACVRASGEADKKEATGIPLLKVPAQPPDWLWSSVQAHRPLPPPGQADACWCKWHRLLPCCPLAPPIPLNVLKDYVRSYTFRLNRGMWFVIEHEEETVSCQTPDMGLFFPKCRSRQHLIEEDTLQCISHVRELQLCETSAGVLYTGSRWKAWKKL